MNLKRISKTAISYLLSAAFVVSMLAGSGCNNPKIIEDYPEPVSITETVDEGEPADGESETETKPAQKEEEDLDEALRANYDSIKETGEFIYNPIAINPVFKMELKNNPRLVRIAKKMLQAIYDCSPELVLDGDEACTEAEFNLARELAALSSPFVEIAEFDTEDNETYTITYFPTYTYDEFGEAQITDGVSTDEAKKKIEAYTDLVTEIINTNITDKDDEMQRAAKIYKYLIENYELDYSEFESEDVVEEDEDGYPKGQVISYNTAENSYIDVFAEDTMYYWYFLRFYEYLMVQLNVDCMLVGCMGEYHDQSFSKMGKVFDGSDRGWVWLIVKNGDDAYHCDMIMDKLALDSQRESFEDYKSDMLYFGMSDEKRNKSYQMYWTRIFESVNPVNSTSLPQCEKDYVLLLK